VFRVANPQRAVACRHDQVVAVGGKNGPRL
jgi:hypothetical protein